MAGLVNDLDARLERIMYLEACLARARRTGRRPRALKTAIRIEAAAYRKSLDIDQVAATRDSKPEPGLDPVSHVAATNARSQSPNRRRGAR
jgi:hypothetical protein